MSNQGLAIITGASAGIGRSYAVALAKQGHDLMIVARRTERLNTLADQCRGSFGVEVGVVSADLSNPSATTQLADRCRAIPHVAVLVNNAGFGTKHTLDKASVDGQLAMLHVHVNATYLLSQAVVPNMIARRSGAIINVSSIAGFFHSAESVNYCATKAYITSFSQGLHDEVGPHGIKVQAFCPGFTRTEFHSTTEFDGFDHSAIPDRLWMSADEAAEHSLEALKKDKVVIIPGWQNKALVLNTKAGPVGKATRLVGKLLWRRKR